MSTFELDVYWAERGADGEAGGDPAVASHVAGCARCQAYLSSLDALEARAPAVPRVSSVRPRARSNRALWALPVTGALAAAAAVGLYVHGRNLESDHYVGIKGTPAVQVLVHRGQATRIWDGHSPLHPGDALALRVACEGLKRVVVASPGGTSGDGHWGRLSDVACPAGDDPLPFTLQVDSEPGDEKLAVVLTQDSIDDPTLQKAIDEERHAQDVWVVRYVMPKETETDR
jgi:hypothetical protein